MFSLRGDGLASVGLRWRLAGWVAAVMLICTAITFVAVYRGTGTQLRQQIDREISGDAGELAHNLPRSAWATPRLVLDAASRYVRDQPFSASSTLLFALVPGAGTSTNRPELFGARAPDKSESQAEQAEENRVATELLTVRTGFSTLQLPDVGNLRVLKRIVQVRAGLPVTLGVGEPLAAVSHAQAGVARAFIVAGLLALAGALLASYLIGTRVSRPLRRMAALAARVDAGDLHHRIHDSGGQGQEIRVLADAFNHMLDRLTEAFASQRAFVADASHELRTPLTVIRGQLEVLANERHPSRADVERVSRTVQAEVARIGRLVDDLLLLAKTDQDQFLRIEAIDLPRFVGDLWDGLGPVAARRLELGPIPPGTLRADPDRLAQALRNLVANAIAHTAPEHGLVRLRVERPGLERMRAEDPPSSRILFLVEDDGPGIPVDQRERVFDRFQRIDAARDRVSGGTGLGLAIVRAIAQAHGGRVAAQQSPEGGARIELELPRFSPAPRRPAAKQDTVRAEPAGTATAGAGDGRYERR